MSCSIHVRLYSLILDGAEEEEVVGGEEVAALESEEQCTQYSSLQAHICIINLHAYYIGMQEFYIPGTVQGPSHTS